MIISLGEWILKEACRIAAMLPGEVHMAVNLSPIQLRHSNFVNVVRSTLEETGLPAGRLELEVTEFVFLEATPTTQSMGDIAIVRAIVDIASALGMTVTAEGVESEEQCLLLRQFGCHQLQGYLFSKSPVKNALRPI